MVVLQGGKRNLQPLSGTMKRLVSNNKNRQYGLVSKSILSGGTRSALTSQSLNVSLVSCHYSNHQLAHPCQKSNSKLQGRFVPQSIRNVSCKASNEYENGHEQNGGTINSEGAQFLEKVKPVLFGDILSRIPSTSLKNSDPWIILLAVSGGCDSIALFHSVVHFLSENKVILSF